MESKIAEAVKEFAPGAQLVRVWPLKGGISATMTAFEIEHADGLLETLVARIPSDYNVEKFGDAVSHEVKTLQTLRDNGLPVAQTYFSNSEFYVLEYLPGAPDLNPTDPSGHLKQYAERLAEIHQVNVEGSGLEFLPSYGFRIWEPEEELVEELRESEIRRALEAFGEPKLNPVGFRHGDYWPGNLLWEEGKLTGVIDWENANLGDPIFDLACTRLDVMWVFGEDAMFEMTERYLEKNPIYIGSLPFWDLRAALRMVDMFDKLAEPYPGFGRPDVTRETMKREFIRFVDLALVASKHI